MKKLYSTSNLVKAVSLGTVMTSLLSSVSPVFAANLAITGAFNPSSSAPGVAYAHGSHGSIVLAGDDNFCGADTVIGRGGIQQANAANPITAEEQYNRFITDQKFVDRNPYGTTTEKVTWGGNSWTNPRGGYMGALTGGVESAMPEAYGVYSFATGCGSAATGNYSTAFGAGATAKTGGAQAFGVSALAAGKVSVAMGVGSEASGEATVAIGGLATASSKNSVALGTKTKADKNYAIAIGSEAEALGSGAIAIGSRDSDRTPEANRKVTAKGENAIAIGTHTYAEAEDSVAIGANAQVKVYDGVAIGGGSLSDRAKGTVGYDPYLNGDSTETGLAWKSTAGAFSVGEVGGNGNGKLTRQITGVAAGSEDTDAVNVAQLKAMRDVIAGGGAWKLSANDTNPTDVNPSNTVDFSVKNNNEVGKDNLKIEKGSANNKHNVKFALSDTLQLTSVTTGQSSMSNNGFMITNGAKITIDGIDAGKQQITGVADATADDHAVNYKQLKEVKDGFKTSWQLSVNGQDATHIGPNGAVNLQSAGNTSNPNIQIIKNSDNTVEFGLSDKINVKNVTAETSVMNADGFMFTDGNGPSITVNGINAGDQKITKVARGTEDTDAVNFAQLNEIKNEMAGDSLVKWDEGQELITIGKEKGGLSITVQNNKGGDRAIRGVASGAVNENSSYAINGSQLYAMGRDIARYFGGGASYDGAWTDPTFIVVQPDEKGALLGKEHHNVADALGGVNNSIVDIYNQINDATKNSLVKWDEGQKLITIGKEKGGLTISVQNNEGRNRVIKGVAWGMVNKNSSDAINGSQLYAMGSDIARYFGGGASYENGTWTNPTFSILQPDEDDIFTSTSYSNVADAFRGVNSSITNLHNRIFDITENSLVKWDEDGKFITIGAEKDGIEIKVANSEGENRIISGVAVGKVSSDSTEAINGHQLFSYITNIVDFFGGEETDVLNGIKPTFTVQKTKHNNVTDAFAAVDSSITDIYSQINNVTENSLVKWHEDQKLITIGKEKGGTKIDIAGTEGERTIAGVKNGKISENSTEAINGSQLYVMGSRIARYFGGGASYENGTWTDPTFSILQPDKDGIFTSTSYSNVADAFRGVNSSITNLHNRIFDITENSLVKWDEDGKFITIGAEKDGIEIKVANSEGENRIISGVAVGKVSSDSTEAINGHQLFSYITNIVDFFGGEETDVLNGIKPTFTVQKTKHNNVTDAFAAVDSSITDIYSQINNVTENSLVKWHEDQKLITIGKEKGGTKIDIAGTEGERTIAGVKNGKISENSTEAINGSQINQISGDIANFFGGNAKFINGAFVKPRYNLTTIEVDGSVRQKEYNDVGSALDGLDKNVRIVNANLISGFSDVAKYFGGGAGYNENGEWHAPTFKVYQINDNGAVSKKPYDNVADAFEGVNNTFTNIHNQISDITKNSLVKQEGGASGVITIGKDTAGTEINIAGYGKVERSISGVKAAEKGDEAVNKDQLDKSIEKISKDIETASAAAVLYDKNDNGNVNYGSVTLGGDKNNGPVALRNVKDGSISENSNDAINGSQINKISADIAKFFGGGAKFINGAFEGLKYTLSAIVDGKVGKANFYDVGSALKGLDSNVQDVNKRLTNVSNEFNQKIEDFSKDALLWDDEEEAFVARHEKDGKKTNSKLKYLLDGEIAKGSTDAITGNQLYFMSNQLANYFGGGAKYENGKWTGPTFKIVQVNADGTTVEKEHHNVADAFGDVNKNMSNINNRIDDVINKVDSDALKWNSDKKAYDAGRDGKPSKIINVADGKIAEGSKDAVNGGQLWETNERVTSVEKDVKHLNNRVDNISTTVTNIGETVFNIENKVNDIAEDAVRYDRDENGKKTNKITLAGGDPSEPVMIDNVADGKIEKGSKEAVNGGQLHDYTQEQMKIILDQSKHYTDQRINNITIDAIDDAVDRAKQYTDMKFDVLNYSIESVKKEARQAAAIGLAVSNLRYNDTPGKLSVGFGTGLWRSQSAFAFGAGYTSENGKYRSNISATTSGGHWGVGAGFNMTLN
ncbi:Vomp family autotransporter [Bartonella sp. MR63HLJHH]|uniref:Vomp family autotransporter n=1 Tax=Bartonella sp. MR63HLJHH TaxID=3243558 RepID=UPI0035CEDCB1